ncbi:MAG TPA: PepSY-associated TM helix domain-containing protein [Vicinamibacterales bacterium]
MPSLREDELAGERRTRGAVDTVLVWNRRVHYYLGLFLLFFIWLFAFTGLLLNHPRWQFAQFWPNRIQSTTEHTIAAVTAANDTDRARDVMRQLGVSGELQWPATQPANGPFTFQVNRPGFNVDVKADLQAGRATVQRTQLNAWGVMHILHTFTGAPAADSRNRRDWTLTTLWALSMDAVAGGLIVMVLGSYVMWFRLRAKRIGGIIALALGFISCGAFIGALRWLL